jgi:hypothetical protein
MHEGLAMSIDHRLGLAGGRRSPIRMMIAGMIEELGHVVVAEAGDIQSALDLAKTADFQFAILDINVGREKIDPVADIIACRAVPFILASGYGAIGVPINFRDRNGASEAIPHIDPG